MAFDPVTVAATAITNVVIKTAWESGGKVLGWMGSGLNETKKQLIFQSARKYVENYTERHGVLKVLGMREPVEVKSVYTNVQFLGQDGIGLFESIATLETAYRETQRRRFQAEKCEKQDGLKVANEKQFLMVLGAPGAGKSTFLKRMGLEALEGRRGKYQHECIPVLLELKDFITGEIDLEAAIANELDTCGFPSAKESTKKLLEKGKLLILLDGLDEIPRDYINRAIGQIQNFVDRYDTNRYIASCRIAAYRSSFRRFTDVVMADFDDAQIEQFIANWFRSERDRQVGTAQQCWKLLQQPDYAATKELAQTPLLLTLLCLVFDDSQTFPKNRAVLYGEALDVLLQRWAAERRIQRNPIYQDLSIALEKWMLAELACRSFVRDQLFFSRQETVDHIKRFLSDNLNAPQHLDGEEVLEAIQIQQGILVERARDVLSFSHLTLQEYLTARRIVNNNGTQTLIDRYLFDLRWREVFLLVAGLLPMGADRFLQQMEQATEKLINTNKLKNLLNWTAQITTDSEGNYKPVEKRAIVLSLAFASKSIPALDQLRYSALILAKANRLDRMAELMFSSFAVKNVLACLHASDDARRFSKLRILSGVDFARLIAQLEALALQLPARATVGELIDVVRPALTNQIRSIWYTALHLNPDWLNLSEAEIVSLQDYFYANELIGRCKEAAVRVSPQAWNGIETRMLTISGDQPSNPSDDRDSIWQ